VAAPSATYLIDTSVWIAVIRAGRRPSVAKARLHALLRGLVVATTDVVYLELLRGARSPADFQALAQTLAVLQYLPVTAERWREAAQLGFALRRQGVNVPSPDLLIAAVAIAHNATLVHRDGDYELIAKHAPLVTESLL
jgi:predicted nucleic acid-binding protein